MLLNLWNHKFPQPEIEGNKYASGRAKPSLLGCMSLDPKNSSTGPDAQPSTQITDTWIADNNQYLNAVQDEPGIITYREAFVCAV